jgi:hypothetical protein
LLAVLRKTLKGLHPRAAKPPNANDSASRNTIAYAIQQQMYLETLHGIDEDSLERFVIIRLVKYLHPRIGPAEYVIHQSADNNIYSRVSLAPCRHFARFTFSRQ